MKKKIILTIFLTFIISLYMIIITLDNASVNYEINDNYKYISFTYDDGPSKYTNDILKILEENDSSATFFMIGNKMEENKDIIKNIYNSKSEIGSHTYSHANITKLNDIQLQNELNKTDEIYYNITNDHLKYFRPPYEYYENSILNINYTIITWNIDPKDWLIKDNRKIYNNVIKNICDGCIVVMHDTNKETVEATKILLESLNNLNYKVVSISNLIKIKGYNIQNNEIISHID